MASAFGIVCTAIFSDSDNAPPTRFVVSSWHAVITHKSHKNMNTKSPECWASDPQARGLRIEVTPERSLLLPFEQFAFGELKSEKKEQQLRLVFATHEVSVTGHSLRKLESAMQRMELSFVGKLPNNQRPLIQEGHPVICEIAVTEVSTNHTNHRRVEDGGLRVESLELGWLAAPALGAKQ
jgi:hypothetical protein